MTSPSIGELLTTAIQQQGYGAKSALADAVGVRPSTVTKWLQGQTAPSDDLRPAIERHLNLPAGSIDEATAARNDDTPTPTILRAARTLESLNESDRRTVMALIERLANL